MFRDQSSAKHILQSQCTVAFMEVGSSKYKLKKYIHSLHLKITKFSIYVIQNVVIFKPYVYILAAVPINMVYLHFIKSIIRIMQM